MILNDFGKGCVITLGFRLSALILKYHLEDHSLLLRNLLDMLTPGKEFEVTENVAGILANVYHAKDSILVHLINGVGKRPRIGNLPVCGYTFTVNLKEGETVTEVTPVIEGTPVRWSVNNDRLTVTLSKLSVWEMVRITLEGPGET